MIRLMIYACTVWFTACLCRKQDWIKFGLLWELSTLNPDTGCLSFRFYIIEYQASLATCVELAGGTLYIPVTAYPWGYDVELMMPTILHNKLIIQKMLTRRTYGYLLTVQRFTNWNLLLMKALYRAKVDQFYLCNKALSIEI